MKTNKKNSKNPNPRCIHSGVFQFSYEIWLLYVEPFSRSSALIEIFLFYGYKLQQMGELRNPFKHILREKGNDSYIFQYFFKRV